MPSPTTRRAFLTKGLTMLAAGGTVPSFISKTAFAVGDPFDVRQTQADSGVDGKVLVVVQLSGGNDGLNTVCPWADDAYHRARPSLAIGPDTALKLNEYVGLHPALAQLKALYDDGRMSVLQGVGYPNPNRSHFRSMDIWHTANPREEAIKSGWLGRYFDSQCAGDGVKNQQAGIEKVAVASDPLSGISIGETNRLAMQGDLAMPLSFDDVRDYRYKGPDRDAFAALHLDADGSNAPSTEKGELDFLTRTAMDAQVSSDRVLKAIDAHNPPADYPRGGFGEGLKMVAAMIRGNMPTRVYYVSLGGFDTHAGQAGRHAQLMGQLAQGVGAFLKDLKQQGNDERVAVMTFSEFGRRVEQNASAGTDHGAAAPMMFFAHGKRLNPGVLGQHPSLTELDQGDLRYTVDFRRAYAGVLHQWLDCDAETVARVLGPGFEPLPLLRG